MLQPAYLRIYKLMIVRLIFFGTHSPESSLSLGDISSRDSQMEWIYYSRQCLWKIDTDLILQHRCCLQLLPVTLKRPAQKMTLCKCNHSWTLIFLYSSFNCLELVFRVEIGGRRLQRMQIEQTVSKHLSTSNLFAYADGSNAFTRPDAL